MKSFRQIFAIQAKNKQRILQVCPRANEKSGIYFLHREENGIKYGYVGQAKRLLTRLADHLKASCGIFDRYTQHIDKSIATHGLYSEKNPTGYKIDVSWCKESELDDFEREAIKIYANAGYQLRNKTAGGQDTGKQGLDNNKQPKGYYDGVKQGYNKARKEVKHLFDKHLKAVVKADKPSKYALNALQKFEDFLQGEEQ